MTKQRQQQGDDWMDSFKLGNSADAVFRGESLFRMTQDSSEAVTDACESEAHLGVMMYNHVDSGCDKYAFCGTLLPNIDSGDDEIINHTPMVEVECYCIQCLALADKLGVKDEQLPDRLWVDAMRIFKSTISTGFSVHPPTVSN